MKTISKTNIEVKESVFPGAYIIKNSKVSLQVLGIDENFFEYPGLLIKMSSKIYCSLNLQEFEKGRVVFGPRFCSSSLEFFKPRNYRLVLSQKPLSSEDSKPSEFILANLFVLSLDGLKIKRSFKFRGEEESLYNFERALVNLKEHSMYIAIRDESTLFGQKYSEAIFHFGKSIKQVSPVLERIKILNTKPLVYYGETPSVKGIATLNKFYTTASSYNSKEFWKKRKIFKRYNSLISRDVHLFFSNNVDSFELREGRLKRLKNGPVAYFYFKGDREPVIIPNLRLIENLSKKFTLLLKDNHPLEKEEIKKIVLKMLNQELKKKKRKI